MAASDTCILIIPIQLSTEALDLYLKSVFKKILFTKSLVF